MRILYGNTPRIYRNTNALTSCSSLPNCKCKIFVINCGHTKCLSWNIKYFLSCWANSTRITWCLCFLKAGTKHTDPPLKTRKLALLFSWRTARALCQLEWLQLCCCPEKSHVRTALGQAFTLSSKLGLGWGPLHSSSVSVPACVRTCECFPSVLSAPWLPTGFPTSVQVGWRAFVACGRDWDHNIKRSTCSMTSVAPSVTALLFARVIQWRYYSRTVTFSSPPLFSKGK